MPRRNIDGFWGEHLPVSVRLSWRAREALHLLRERWGCSRSEAIRRALLEAAARPESLSTPSTEPASK